MPITIPMEKVNSLRSMQTSLSSDAVLEKKISIAINSNEEAFSLAELIRSFSGSLNQLRSFEINVHYDAEIDNPAMAALILALSDALTSNSKLYSLQFNGYISKANLLLLSKAVLSNPTLLHVSFVANEYDNESIAICKSIIEKCKQQRQLVCDKFDAVLQVDNISDSDLLMLIDFLNELKECAGLSDFHSMLEHKESAATKSYLNFTEEFDFSPYDGNDGTEVEQRKKLFEALLCLSGAEEFWKQHKSALTKTIQKIHGMLLATSGSYQEIRDIAITALNQHCTGATFFTQASPSYLFLKSLAACDDPDQLTRYNAFVLLSAEVANFQAAHEQEYEDAVIMTNPLYKSL